MDNQRFALNSGRKRPTFKPRDIHCPGCGAGLTLKDERSELVVCEFCGSHLDVSTEEKTVLGKGPGRQWNFPLSVGDSYQHKGARFEILARMAFIEDGDVSEVTRAYYLYNPFKGTRWLYEYGGNYSLSRDTHVMPTADPFTRPRGSVLETHDGRKWVALETGVYELAYVDGSLPWLAKVGDQVQYAEFADKSGSALRYDVERIANEVEFSTGQVVALEAVRQATGKPELGQGVPRLKPEDVAKTRRAFMMVIMVSLLIFVVNAVLAVFCMWQGREVLRQSFAAEELSDEVISQSFQVADDGNVIEVEVTASGLNNAWISVDLAIVEGDSLVKHLFESDMQYYHGVEGGESWSEGGNSDSSYIQIPAAGQYRLLLKAVSGLGESETADRAQHALNVVVIDDVIMPHFFWFMAIVAGILLFFTFLIFQGWKKANDA